MKVKKKKKKKPTTTEECTSFKILLSRHIIGWLLKFIIQ